MESKFIKYYMQVLGFCLISYSYILPSNYQTIHKDVQKKKNLWCSKLICDNFLRCATYVSAILGQICRWQNNFEKGTEYVLYLA